MANCRNAKNWIIDRPAAPAQVFAKTKSEAEPENSSPSNLGSSEGLPLGICLVGRPDRFKKFPRFVKFGAGDPVSTPFNH